MFTYPVTSGIPGANLLDGLVAWYALEATGTPQSDSTGSHNLPSGSSAGSGTGKLGNGEVFPGSSLGYYIASGSAGAFKPADSSFTAACWAKPTAGATFSDGAFGCFTTASGGLGWGIAIGGSDNTSWEFKRGENSGTSQPYINTGAGTLTLNAWHLLIVWRDATAQECGIQLNNNTPVTSAQVLGLGVPNYAFSVGSVISNPFVGTVDEAAYWSRALGVDDRALLWNGGAGITYSSL